MDQTVKALNLINLRGKVIPVVDLRLRFGMEDILGIAKVEGGVKMLLDTDRVLSAEEIAVLKTAS